MKYRIEEADNNYGQETVIRIRKEGKSIAAFNFQNGFFYPYLWESRDELQKKILLFFIKLNTCNTI